jgi:tetratricopeptide (TPR) repeat protein
MNHERIKQLLVFRSENPNDPFLIYALATEYKENDPNKAKEYFDILLSDFPEYIGTYYHAAALYADHFDRLKAEDIYKNGIQVAKKLNELHALKELKNAFLNFQFEE